MRILVCVKRVPITGGKMVLTDDAQAIETKHLGFTISPHEECAVEEAVRIVEAGGGEVVVLTLGPAEAEEQLRDCMAIGADRGDPARDGRRGLGRTGDGGRDRRRDPRRARAVRPAPVRQRVGRRRRLPGRDPRRARARAAGRHRPEEDRAGRGRVRCERDVGGARDVYEAPLPAVLTVLEGLNLPRYPSVPGRLRAKQKPLARTAVSPPAAQLEKLRLIVPEGQGKEAEILGEGAAAAPRVVEVLQELGVA